MKAGNAYLPEFMADFNRRFAVAPRNPEDAHRAVAHDAAELDLILCEHHARKLTKNLTVRFECREYQVTGRGRGYRLRGAAVTVCKAFDGSVRVLRDGRELGRAVARRRRGGGPGGRRVRRFAGEWTWPRRSSSRGPPTSRRRTILGGGRRSGARRGSPPDEGLGAVRPWASVATLPTPKAEPAPRPVFHQASAAKRPGGQGGHFYFGQKGTFLLCVDNHL